MQLARGKRPELSSMWFKMSGVLITIPLRFNRLAKGVTYRMFLNMDMAAV